MSSEGSYVTQTGDTLWVLPDKDIKNKLIANIDTAESRIWIEIYMWTDMDILRAMTRAHDRGVDVRAILEGNVYSLPYVNKRVFDGLREAGISVMHADTYRYTFTHAKFWIIDERFFISTGNLTRSFFEGNRDFIFSSADTLTLQFLEEVFARDFSHAGVNPSLVPPHVVISPLDARSKIEQLLSSATTEIIIYTQTLDDDSMKEILQSQHDA